MSPAMTACVRGWIMSNDIVAQLKVLKLHGMAANYPEVVASARHTDFNPETFLHQLLKAETAEREVRSIAYQMGRRGSRRIGT